MLVSLMGLSAIQTNGLLPFWLLWRLVLFALVQELLEVLHIVYVYVLVVLWQVDLDHVVIISL